MYVIMYRTATSPEAGRETVSAASQQETRASATVKRMKPGEA
jgi:hypothetical protein